MTVMLSTVIMPAVITVMLMMIAMSIRIIFQMTLCQSQSRLIGIALHPGKQLDTGVSQRHLRTHPDAPADQCIHLGCLQESR